MSRIKDINIVAGTGEKQSYVVAGAILSCSFGDKINRLKMPFSHGVYIKGKPQMNIMDYVPNVNIMPFGKCSSLANPAVASATAANNGVLTPQPCTPMTTMPWIDGKTDVLVEGQPALLNKCTNCCLYAGIIKIEDDGQELSLTISKQAQQMNSKDVAGVIPTTGSPLSGMDGMIPSADSVQNNESNNWNRKIAANWTINELMEKEKQATSEEKRQEYSKKAESLRQRLRNAGVPEDQILQATSSYIPNDQVMEIAQANVEQRIKDDPLGFGLMSKGYQVGMVFAGRVKTVNRAEGVADIINRPKTPAERAAEKGFPGIKTSPNGGPDFAGTPYMYPVKDGQRNIVTIKLTGDRQKDFKEANEEAGFPDAGRKSPDSDYTWHHYDDYDPVTNTSTMQLVRSDAHEATLPHKGSCSQYDDHHGEKKYNPPKKKKPKKGPKKK